MNIVNLPTDELYGEIQESKISIADLTHLWKNIEAKEELEQICKNTLLVSQIVEQNICSFQELVSNCKDSHALATLLQNESLFEKLIENSTVTEKDLKMLMNVLYEKEDYTLFKKFSENVTLVTHLLKNFLFDTEFVNKANEVLEQHTNEGKYL